jgi:hypothetical protein
LDCPFRCQGADAGHVYGKNLGGSEGVDHIFPQNLSLNRGEFRVFEDDIVQNMGALTHKYNCIMMLEGQDLQEFHIR